MMVDRGSIATIDNQLPFDLYRPFTWKSHPVDDSLVFDQSKDTRPGVARLRTQRDRPDFKMTKTQCCQPTYGYAILVITRGQANRVFEFQSENFHRLFRRRERCLQ